MARNGQAALEFLTTYGWAFLVIIVMIGALAYFGILNPSRFLPDRCTFPTEVPCQDAQIVAGTTPTVSFYLANNLGNSITIDKVNATFIDTNVASSTCTFSPSSGSILASGSIEINCTNSAWNLQSGSKAKFTVSGNYTVTGGRYPKEFEGDIYSMVK